MGLMVRRMWAGHVGELEGQEELAGLIDAVGSQSRGSSVTVHVAQGERPDITKVCGWGRLHWVYVAWPVLPVVVWTTQRK